MKTYKSLVEEIESKYIMVDGIQKHTTNSEGHPIHHTDEGIKNFHRWFGDSKAVDEHGKPKVFYHGTNSNIEEFSHNFSGKGTNAYGPGFYFTSNKNIANNYTSMSDLDSNVTPVYLKVSKPINNITDKPFTWNHIRSIIKSANDHKDT